MASQERIIADYPWQSLLDANIRGILINVKCGGMSVPSRWRLEIKTEIKTAIIGWGFCQHVFSIDVRFSTFSALHRQGSGGSFFKRARNAHETRTKRAHDSHTTRTKRAQIGEGWIFRNLPRAIRDLTAQFCISWNISFLEFWIFTSSYRIACWSCRLNQEGCRWGQSAACLSLLDSR